MKSPEKLLLEALQFAQAMRHSKGDAKEMIRGWREFDALAAEAIAALAKRNAPLSDERKSELEKIGRGLGFILGLQVDTEENERFFTRWGTKTGLGLCLILERFIRHMNGDTDFTSLADECRAYAAEAEKLFDQARRRKAQYQRQHLTRAEFYERKK